MKNYVEHVRLKTTSMSMSDENGNGWPSNTSSWNENRTEVSVS